jgi:tetrahydromethanopterin S-methyltransferase subunit F
LPDAGVTSTGRAALIFLIGHLLAIALMVALLVMFA